MDVSAPAVRAKSRSGAYVAAGLAAWLCGAGSIAVAGVLVVTLIMTGWHDVVGTIAAPASFGTTAALRSSAWLIATALPLAVVLSFFAGVAAAEPAIGGQTGKLLNVSLRAGPAAPSVAFGAAIYAVVVANPRIEHFVAAHPIAAAAAALAAFNLPIMTARFRGVIRAVPRFLRVAAMAAGATPESAFLRIVLPLAWSGIFAVVLEGVGQMLGETALVAIVFGFDKAFGAPAPLAVQLWSTIAFHDVDAATISAAGAETLLIVAAIVALRFAAQLLAHRRRSTRALS